MTYRNAIRSLTAMLAMLLGSIAYGTDDLDYSNKWRIECSGNAESDGIVRFRVTPADGKPTEVTVRIEGGRSENGVARDIRDAFRAQLPRGTYDIETDDGEDVLIKKNLLQDRFSLELLSATVDDVRLDLEQE